MSQVNDSLKRVRDTQLSAPRPDAPQLRPPAPAPTPARGIGLILPILFAVVALLGLVGLVLLWQLQQKRTAPEATAEPASESAQTASTATPRPATSPKIHASASVTPSPARAIPPTPVIKLQGILYAGRNSSAMISGQAVAIGDEVGGYRVAAIGERSVTLVSGSHTNVLTLSVSPSVGR